MKDFLDSYYKKSENYFKLIELFVSKGASENAVKQNIDEFVLYWTEQNKSGTKEKWGLQKCFDVRKRLYTWFRNSQKWAKPEKTWGNLKIDL